MNTWGRETDTHGHYSLVNLRQFARAIPIDDNDVTVIVLGDNGEMNDRLLFSVCLCV